MFYVSSRITNGLGLGLGLGLRGGGAGRFPCAPLPLRGVPSLEEELHGLGGRERLLRGCGGVLRPGAQLEIGGLRGVRGFGGGVGSPIRV